MKKEGIRLIAQMQIDTRQLILKIERRHILHVKALLDFVTKRFKVIKLAAV